MPNPPKKQRLTDKKRASILAAAVAEFQKNGFDGTSMDRVSAAAEVSKRTVYNHFKSKDELFAAIIAEVRERFGEIEEIQYDSDAELQPQLVAIGEAIAAVTASEEFIKLARVVIARFMQAPEFAMATMQEQEDYNQGLVAWIKAANDDGRLSVEDADHAATEFTGLIKSFAFWPQLIGSCAPLNQKERDTVIESSAEMFLCRYRK